MLLDHGGVSGQIAQFGSIAIASDEQTDRGDVGATQLHFGARNLHGDLLDGSVGQHMRSRFLTERRYVDFFRYRSPKLLIETLFFGDTILR